MINHLVNQIAHNKINLASGTSNFLNSENTLTSHGFQQVKEDAFVKIAAKVQSYIDLSLNLRKRHPEFGGMPPTELIEKQDGQLVPKETTAAIDQQRQLYAAARTTLIDPAYGDQIMGELIEWHDAFLHYFVIDRGGPKVRAKVIFGSTLDSQDPDPKANLRLTYALQGSATLVLSLRAAANRCVNPEEARKYLAKADEIEKLSIAIGEQFYRDYADVKCPGRYFLYPHGANAIEVLSGLSHNNSQSYLIEGMAALVELDQKRWQPRLRDLLSFIHTQRDPASGLLHEFDFEANFVSNSSKAILQSEFNWQAQENHETVILGHTIAGFYAWQSKIIADSSDSSKQGEMEILIHDFIETMNRIGGIKENGLPANAFQLIPDSNPPFKLMGWSEGAWQAELLWQFLLHADRVGIDLSKYEVSVGTTMLTLDRLFARGLDFHDKWLFNGLSYVIENGNPLKGREYAAPINHAADTLRDLISNLER